MREIKRGQIWSAMLDGIGSEQTGTRPVLILQNDTGNKFSPTTIIAIITSRKTKAKLPTHYWIGSGNGTGLTVPSMIELEQIRTIDKARLKKCLGTVGMETDMPLIEQKIKVSLGLK